MTTKKKKYIKADNLPPKISILWPIVWWLVLERFDAPGWLYGVLFTFIGLIYMAETWRMVVSDAVDVVGNDDA